jgi:hypothetical protein
MLEVSFFHQVQNVLSVEGYSMDYLNFGMKQVIEREYLLDPDTVRPKFQKVDVSID